MGPTLFALHTHQVHLHGMLPEPLKEKLNEVLTEQEGSTEITAFTFASGGCINSAGSIETTKSEYFVKWNKAGQFPGMFKAEFEGLQHLAVNTELHIPRPIVYGETEEHTFLVMENIQTTARADSYWQALASGLISIHRASDAQFGLDTDNYIGSLPQANTLEETWPEFFVLHRLTPQLKLAFDSGKMSRSSISALDTLTTRLPAMIPEEIPSLLHGDLWGGNLITGGSGEPVLIDPAIYYGHREMDLAFTRMFGGFGEEFYEAYDDLWPLEPGFEERVDLHNLYPLLVHVNLFGGGYISQAERFLKRF